MIRAGLFLYDHLGRGANALRGRSSSLPRSRRVSLAPGGLGAGRKPEFDNGFSYHDCWVDDARLVVLNARSAASRGAEVLTHTRLASARREPSGDGWELSLVSGRGQHQAAARVLVNAAGPWVKSVLDKNIGVASRGGLRLVRGSHIVVPRLHDKGHAFILQNPDRRIVFMIPYEREFTLIGTTDAPVDSADESAWAHPRASESEIAYLCEAASRYSAVPVTPRQVVWSYSGVRALYDDGSANPSAVTRDYHLLLDAGQGRRGQAPLLSVFGGKITTYRRLAEEVLARLAPGFPGSESWKAWTHAEPLPGGDFTDFSVLLNELQIDYPRLPPPLVARLARRHGTLVRRVVGKAGSIDDLGEHYGGGLYEAELRYLVKEEWASEAEDVLWRRTKCGLHMNEDERLRLADALRGMV
jgi:glycerol-3-phosphate dehydrogenase